MANTVENSPELGGVYRVGEIGIAGAHGTTRDLSSHSPSKNSLHALFF